MAAAASELSGRARTRPQPRARQTVAVALAQVPSAAWLCALVAVLNAVAWSLIVPAFQVPDEQSHFAYAEYLAQHGRPPIPQPSDRYSDAQGSALLNMRVDSTRFVPDNVGVWTAYEQRRLERDLNQRRDRSGGNGAALAVGGEPPLYYALQGIPYRLAAGGTVLDQLALMRLLSALLAGATVLFVFLFLREALPGHPWSWTVGALGVAFQPLFAFISGGVNSDALLYAASAAVFYLLARAFRRGLTPGLATAIGVAMAVGLLTKFNALGLLPGALLALLAIAVRQDGALRLRTLRLPALTLAIAAAPALLEALLNVTVWDRPAVGASASSFALRADIHPTLGGALNYAWQFYLFPLPGLERPLGGLALWDEWFKGFVGLFGWIDTAWADPVYRAALVPFAVVAALAVRAVAIERRALRRRRLELLAYGVVAGTFVLFVAVASYVIYLRYHANVAQARYLLPLLALYGGLLALAVRGAGRRWAPVVGTAIVVLAIAHDVFAQFLVVSRYYA
jgi:4-amino-4-deoxy-L-arabinose transferase-like glycosyltransferase